MWDCLIKDGLKQEFGKLTLRSHWYGLEPNQFGICIDLLYDRQVISSTCVNMFDDK